MKLRITITGKVHDVGYRLFLLNQADSLLINKFDARNVVIGEKQALIVLVEGEEKQIKEFLEFVKSEKPEKAVVEEIKVEDYDGPIRSIDSYRNSLMLEQLNKIVQTGLKMLEKQDETIRVIREEGEKTRESLASVIREESEKTRDHLGKKIDESKEYLARKIDVVAEKIDESKEYLGKKIDDLRTDLRSYLDERLRKIEREIEEIKARIGMA